MNELSFFDFLDDFAESDPLVLLSLAIVALAGLLTIAVLHAIWSPGPEHHFFAPRAKASKTNGAGR